jgi:hypothetical protein
MKTTCLQLFLSTGLAMASLGCASFAAEPPPADALRVNYQIEVEIAPNDGPPLRFKIVTLGERVRANYVLPQAQAGDVETPSVVNFEAEMEPLTADKVWLRNFHLGQHMPFVTGMTRSAAGVPAREPRLVEPGVAPEAGAAPGERPRVVERRRVRDADEVPDAPPGDAQPGPRGAVRGFAGPGGMMRQVQSMDTGTMSSAILTVGKPLTVIESPTQRVTFTVRKLDN